MSDELEVKTEESVASSYGGFKTKKFWIKLAIVAVIVLVGGFLITRYMSYSGIINPYEHDYIDVTGKTAEDIAKEKGMEYNQFLKHYGLPEDMPRSTHERAVFYNIPVGVVVERSANVGTFDKLKAEMGWGDEITESTTIGEALDITTLSAYVGEEQLQRFKSLYELPDDVTGDTLYGEVRNLVDSKEKDFREASDSRESYKK